MSVHDILLLGNPLLYESCQQVEQEELDTLRPVIQDLHETLFDFRKRHGMGRAIAAPQIGIRRRLIYMHIGEPTVFINPVLIPAGAEQFEVWDDCMSFPDLLVKVLRYRRCRISYRDLDWNEHNRVVENDLSELLQHECDHLDGILAVDRAIDGRSFALKSQHPKK